MRSCWVCSIDPVGNSYLNKSQSKIAILTNSVHSPSLSLFVLYHSIYFIVIVEGKSAKSSSDRKSSN